MINKRIISLFALLFRNLKVNHSICISSSLKAGISNPPKQPNVTVRVEEVGREIDQISFQKCYSPRLIQTQFFTTPSQLSLIFCLVILYSVC